MHLSTLFSISSEFLINLIKNLGKNIDVYQFLFSIFIRFVIYMIKNFKIMKKCMYL